MKLNPKEKAVLAGVLWDAEDLAGTDPASLGLPHGVALGRVKMKIADAKAGYVPMNLAGWIGHAPAPANPPCSTAPTSGWKRWGWWSG